MADSKRDLIQAQHQYTAALDGLRRLIGADLTPAMRATDIVLEDDAAAIPAKTEFCLSKRPFPKRWPHARNCKSPTSKFPWTN